MAVPWIMAPLKPSFSTAARELVGGGGRIGGRQRREGGEAIGFLSDDRGEAIVDAAAHLDRHVGLDVLHRGRAVRDHLDVDPGLVHLLEAQFAEVGHPSHDLGIAFDGRVIGRELLVPVVFFDRDDRTFRLLQHGVSPKLLTAAS